MKKKTFCKTALAGIVCFSLFSEQVHAKTTLQTGSNSLTKKIISPYSDMVSFDKNTLINPNITKNMLLLKAYKTGHVYVYQNPFKPVAFKERPELSSIFYGLSQYEGYTRTQLSIADVVGSHVSFTKPEDIETLGSYVLKEDSVFKKKNTTLSKEADDSIFKRVLTLHSPNNNTKIVEGSSVQVLDTSANEKVYTFQADKEMSRSFIPKNMLDMFPVLKTSPLSSVLEMKVANQKVESWSLSIKSDLRTQEEKKEEAKPYFFDMKYEMSYQEPVFHFNHS